MIRVNNLEDIQIHLSALRTALDGLDSGVEELKKKGEEASTPHPRRVKKQERVHEAAAGFMKYNKRR